MKDMTKLVELESLSVKILPHKRLFSGVSLSIKPSQSVALMGPSGSGKTTLALAIMGLAPPEVQVGGLMQVLGKSWAHLSHQEKQNIHLEKISMIFQDPSRYLNPFFTIEFQLKEILCSLKRDPKQSYRRIMDKALQEVGLEASERYLKSYPHQLSGGEKQRIMIAMALLCDPVLLIADEPTASLDFIVEVEILKLIQSIQKKRGLSLFLITHNPLIAQKMADQIYGIKEEKILLL